MCNQSTAKGKITTSAMEALMKQVEELHNDSEQYRQEMRAKSERITRLYQNKLCEYEAKWQQYHHKMRARSERIAELYQNKVCEFLL
jgi:uncharacterized coiled-coil DUF342 family protein